MDLMNCLYRLHKNTKNTSRENIHKPQLYFSTQHGQFCKITLLTSFRCKIKFNCKSILASTARFSEQTTTTLMWSKLSIFLHYTMLVATKLGESFKSMIIVLRALWKPLVKTIFQKQQVIFSGYFFLCLFLFKMKYSYENFCCLGVHLFHRDFYFKSEKSSSR